MADFVKLAKSSDSLSHGTWSISGDEIMAIPYPSSGVVENWVRDGSLVLVNEDGSPRESIPRKYLPAPEDQTVEQLKDRAAEAGVKDSSKLSKKQLTEAVKEAEGSTETDGG